MYKYAIEIFYSEEDEGYIAVVPELPGCSAFGKTEEEALREIKTAIELWLETAKKKVGRYLSHMEKNYLTYYYINKNSMVLHSHLHKTLSIGF